MPLRRFCRICNLAEQARRDRDLTSSSRKQSFCKDRKPAKRFFQTCNFCDQGAFFKARFLKAVNNFHVGESRRPVKARFRKVRLVRVVQIQMRRLKKSLELKSWFSPGVMTTL
jgi:hypothetical protein